MTYGGVQSRGQQNFDILGKQTSFSVPLNSLANYRQVTHS